MLLWHLLTTNLRDLATWHIGGFVQPSLSSYDRGNREVAFETRMPSLSGDMHAYGHDDKINKWTQISMTWTRSEVIEAEVRHYSASTDRALSDLRALISAWLSKQIFTRLISISQVCSQSNAFCLKFAAETVNIRLTEISWQNELPPTKPYNYDKSLKILIGTMFRRL